MTNEQRIDERLREAWLASGPAIGPEHACPTDEEIRKAARGDLPPSRAGEILDHAIACATCAASLALAAELGREENVLAFRPRRRMGVLMLAGVAAAAVIFAAGLALSRRSVPAGPSPAALAGSVQATLWKAGDGRATRLSGGQRVRPGDKLYVSLDNDAPVNLYVLDKDEAGEVSVLFPVEGAQWSNPIEPGRGRRIPGETTWEYDSWEVSSAGGSESFIVVASLSPVEELESAIRLMDEAAPRDLVRGGAPPDGEGSAAHEGAQALDAALAKLRSSPRLGSDLWLEEIDLDNPR